MVNLHNNKWSGNFAYITGLLTTDGYLSSDKRHITFTSTDLQLITVLKKCLSLKNKVSSNPPSSISKKLTYRIQFGDTKLYKKLTEIGLSTKKSLVLHKVGVPDKYFRDFLRGLLDGDGSIIQYKDSYNTPKNPKYIYNRLFVYFISASEKHIYWLQREILRLIHIHGSISKNVSKSQIGKSVCSRLKFSTKEAKTLLNWIYYKPKLPCLIRKYEIAKPYLKNTHN